MVLNLTTLIANANAITRAPQRTVTAPRMEPQPPVSAEACAALRQRKLRWDLVIRMAKLAAGRREVEL